MVLGSAQALAGVWRLLLFLYVAIMFFINRYEVWTHDHTYYMALQ